MTNNSCWFSGFLAAAVLVGGSLPSAARASDPVLHDCFIKLEDRYNVLLPAKEAGVLRELNARQGSRVSKNERIGRIDDLEAQKQKEASEYAAQAAYQKAIDDVQVRYAAKSAEVAEAKYQKMLQSNQGVSGSVPDIEVLTAKLEWVASTLSAEKAKHEQDLAKFEYRVKRVEFDAAKAAIERREILAPFDGEVVEIMRKQDEWVSPGDPILQFVRLDTMMVVGRVDPAAFDPHELQNCEVTVDVEMARGRKEQVTGRIIYVSPLLDSGGKYVARAEVANRQERGRWLLSDGMLATMTIHLNTGDVAPINVSRAQ